MPRIPRAPLVVLALLAGCGGAAEPVPPRSPRPSAERATARASRTAPRPAARATERGARDPEALAADADAIYQAQLALRGRDERFAVDRQVTELRRAILLYEQFIERADGDPEFADTVKRSRERIEDARATIAFLLEGVEAGVLQ